MDMDDFLLSPDGEKQDHRSSFAYETAEVTRARELDRRGRCIEVLITVKTAPQPSRKYDDTVCVAGIALNPFRLVRLYPIAYRHLAQEKKFNKYAIISVKVQAPNNDLRIESLRIDPESIKILGHPLPWDRRAEIVSDTKQTTMCQLLDQVKDNRDGPSLGIVHVREAMNISFKISEGWTDKQLERLKQTEARKQQPKLWGSTAPDPPKLIAPPLIARLEYKCDNPKCSGHHQGILDWELRALMLKETYANQDSEKLRAAIRNNFLTIPSSRDRDLWVYVGNQHDPMKRKTFSVLGMFYPKKEYLPGSRLF